jgi:homocysteine S-methyltransferase
MVTKTAFLSRIEDNSVIFLDGGLSNQLEAQGLDLNHQLWSANVLLNNPQAIIDAHVHYLTAGAHCIITASYQASIMGFNKLGLSQHQAQTAISLSVELARQAIDQHMHSQDSPALRPLIAASIGPYGAHLADGSEYHGNYGVDEKQLSNFHQARLDLLDQSCADVLACETLPSLQEAKVLAQLLLKVNTPAWISFSCLNGQQLNDGSAIEDAALLFAQHPKVVAIGVNCTSAQYINELITRIKSVVNNKAIVVYPNAGQTFDATTKTWHGTSSPLSCAHAAKSWIDAGATIIGGCCRMGPEHIKAMKRSIMPV